MLMLGNLCRALAQNPDQTQRQLAKRLGVSLGKCHTLFHHAQEEGYIAPVRDNFALTDKGRDYLAQFKVENAIILAAGIDVRFVPYTHEKPKSLMRIEGERIIERQIRQLHQRGITDITVVVGYLAEKFEYLADKFGVKLIFNPEYTTKSNVASLYLARHLLGNTYLLASDHWMWENIFQQHEPLPWFCCHWHEGGFDGWTAQTNGRRRILSIKRGGRDKLAIRGPVCFTREFSQQVIPLIEQEYHDGLEAERWETVLQGHFSRIPIYANVVHPDMVQHFNTLDELRDFDISYAEQSGNGNLRHIASIFQVPEGQIHNLTWLDAGMTNQSFRFELDGQAYIYRIPGEGSENYISRRQEAAVYKAIAPLGISDEVIFIDPASGIKITRFYPNQGDVSPDNRRHMAECMRILRRLHLSGAKVKHVFNIEDKLERFEAMCRKVDCIRFEDFEETRKKIEIPLGYIKGCDQPMVLCHIDAATNNFLVLDDGSIKLIDWEYGGMCHAVADVAMTLVFDDFPVEAYDGFLEDYFGRPATLPEKTLCLSYAAVAGLLWSLWAEYRQYYGEDFGEYAMSQYRIAKSFTREVNRLLALQQGHEAQEAAAGV